MSDEQKTIERIWVGIRQGAEITGRRKEDLRGLAVSIWRQPAEERPLKIRFRSNRYEFWLPDLINYIETSPDPFPTQNVEVEPIWVTTTEAMETTGYSFQYVQALARKMWRQPEADRIIKVRMRSGRYELWLPNLIYYLNNIGNGPEPRKTPIE